MSTYSHQQIPYSYPTQIFTTGALGTNTIAAGSSASTVSTALTPPNSIQTSVSPNSNITGITALSPSSTNNNNSNLSQSTSLAPNWCCSSSSAGSANTTNIINNKNNNNNNNNTSSSSSSESTNCVPVTDPVAGQTVYSYPYDSTALPFSQYSHHMSVYGATPYPSTDQNPYQSISMDNHAYFPSLGSPTANETMSHWTGTGLQPTTGYYHYDPAFAAYGYGPGYDIAARRKNATRESTSTLKAWLHEHKKNPYPTKGEKIMLAIITKMTLTQVSTWFANARRRLKKENKMTWEMKNKVDDNDDGLTSDSDDHKGISDGIKQEHDLKDEMDSHSDENRTDLTQTQTLLPSHHLQTTLYSSSKSDLKNSDCEIPLPATKPKIWSLADTAASKTPPPPPPPTLPQPPSTSLLQQINSPSSAYHLQQSHLENQNQSHNHIQQQQQQQQQQQHLHHHQHHNHSHHQQHLNQQHWALTNNNISTHSSKFLTTNNNFIQQSFY